jgi:hypothetical protein
MKLKWVLILLIGMISFTGFSSTADLTKNSDLEFVSDVDVGSVEALIVETVKANPLEVKTQIVVTPFLILEPSNKIRYQSKNYKQIIFRTVKPPDLTYMKNTAGMLPTKSIITAPRDKLNFRSA